MPVLCTAFSFIYTSVFFGIFFVHSGRKGSGQVSADRSAARRCGQEEGRRTIGGVYFVPWEGMYYLTDERWCRTGLISIQQPTIYTPDQMEERAETRQLVNVFTPQRR